MAITYDFARIGSDEMVAGRTFADPTHNDADRQALVYMASCLREFALASIATLPLIQVMADANGRYFRVVICQPSKLFASDSFFVVGFFGQKRSNAVPGVLSQVDEMLVSGLVDKPYVVSYSSLELEDGNYGNLVVLSEDGGRESWRESKTHQYAVAELSPEYYESVRLHNGVMRGVLNDTPTIELTSTKYFDYRDGFWCGLRVISK